MPASTANSTPGDRSRRQKRSGGSVATTGRQQIIEAAIASIKEVGFYRSSTNEIARRANVSWGAVQYHFGTRELLMLAVVEELNRRENTALEQAEVTGSTPEERITSLYEILGSHYDSPTYLVWLQIVLNLQHDPNTSDEVSAEIKENALRARATVNRLLHEALGPRSTESEVEALFHTLRGFAISQQVARAVPTKVARRHREATRIFLRSLAAGIPPNA